MLEVHDEVRREGRDRLLSSTRNAIAMPELVQLSIHHAKRYSSLHLDRPLLKTMTQSLKGKSI